MLRFATDSSTVRVLSVLEREPVVGPIAFEALVADRAEYREAMKAYRPNLDAIATIRKLKAPIEIEAYFGSWCSHCKMFMPKFLRVMQDAATPAIHLTLVGVPKAFGAQDGPWKGKNITGIPAIIVSRKGSEMARLDAHENAEPESELAAIVGAIK
jgi:thiol-disulfide isomerase/thioredoxin